MKSESKQRDFQKKLLAENGLDHRAYQSQTSVWWRNPTNPDSLRLSYIGFRFFTKVLGNPHHIIELASPLKSKHLLQLERLFSDPYYINNQDIIVLGEQDAIMLQLHAGNLDQYLENLQINKS